MQVLAGYSVPVDYSLGLVYRPNPIRRVSTERMGSQEMVWGIFPGQKTIAPAWSTARILHNTLLVFHWGTGHLTPAVWGESQALWLAVEYKTAEVVQMHGCIKVPSYRTIAVGIDRKEIAGFIRLHTPPEASMRGQSFFEEKHASADLCVTVGDGGKAVVDGCGAATAGRHGYAEAGYGGRAHTKDYGSALAGDYGTAAAGREGKAEAGRGGKAHAGVKGLAIAGDGGQATVDREGTAIVGEGGEAFAWGGVAIAGDGGRASADKGKAKAGAGGKAFAHVRGSAEVGEGGIAEGGRVKGGGGIGACLRCLSDALAEPIIAVVGEGGIKPDTWYRVVDSMLVEET